MPDATRLPRPGAALLALALAVLVLALADRPEEVVVLFPPDGLASSLPAGARIVAAGPSELTIRGAQGLAEALRAAGAAIVLGARAGACAATGPD